MNILHIIDSLPPDSMGGAGRIAMDIAEHQQVLGNSVTILTASKNPGKRIEKGVRIIALRMWNPRWSQYASVFSLKREQEIIEHIKRVHPSIIHIHVIANQMGFRWICEAKALGIRIVATCHDATVVRYGKVTEDERHPWLKECMDYRWQWNPFRTMLSKKMMNMCDHIMVVSDALRLYLKRNGLTNLVTVHNGIDCAFWKPTMNKRQARERLSLPQDRCLFLLAGRLGKAKGSILVAEALPSGAGIILAGERFSDEFAPLRDRMSIFPNQSPEEMKLLYTACDAVLAPSLYLDPFPTVCLEGMAMERPIIATSLGGAKEAVKDGESGWIIDPLHIQQWNERMTWCMQHPAELVDFGHAGRERMLRSFQREQMLDRIEKTYRTTKKQTPLFTETIVVPY